MNVLGRASSVGLRGGGVDSTGVARPNGEAGNVSGEARAAVPTIGVVVIGRNEGERLKTCLASVVGRARQIVYVDSGSTDGSVELARAMGVAVLELDMRAPFTAGRARNAGFRRLRDLVPDLDYVQFVDGDCEVVSGWLDKAAAFLDAHPRVAVVSGRRRERYPERSLYNMFSAIEWDGHPVGESRACGGDALMRVDAFAAMNGYRPNLIAGEEPELCIRLRAAGWRIWFLNENLTWHDAAMTRFGQWWKRAMRTGYGLAQGASLHGMPPEYHCMRPLLSSWLWALALPAVTLALVLAWNTWAALLLLLYPLQIVRVAMRGAYSFRINWWHALFLMLAKFANMLGQLKFLAHRLFQRQPRLIDYKS